MSRWHARPLSVGLVLALIAVLAAGAPGLTLNASYTAYFDPADPLLAVDDELAHRYARFDGVAVILESRDGDMLSANNLALLETLTADAATLRHAARVDSPSTIPLDTAHGETLATHPLAARRLISADRRFAVLRVGFDLPEPHAAALLLDTVNALRKLVSETIESSGAAVDAHYTGSLALNEAYVQVVRADLRKFVPALLTVFALLLTVLFRNALCAAVTLGCAALAVGGTFGAAGWLDAELASLHAFAPVIIASLCVAGAVHVIMTHLRNTARGSPPERAAADSVATNLAPLSLTCATTALGFLSLTLSPSPPVRSIGCIVAGGVALNWLLSLTLLPWCLRRVRARPGSGPGEGMGIALVIRIVTTKPRVLLLGFLAAAVVSAGWMRDARIDDNLFEYFPDRHAFRQATAIAQRELSGINEIFYEFATGEDYGLFGASALDRLDAFADWLREQPEVVRAVAITDLPEVQTLLREGDSKGALTTYRLQAKYGASGDLPIEREIDARFSSTQLTVYLAALDASGITAFDGRVRGWATTNAAPFEVRGGAGASLIFAHLGQRNARMMLASFGAALVVISLVSGLLLRAWRGAAAALVCNVFPVLLVYALWTASGGHISLGGAVVLGMILGVVVDDTIFLLSRYAGASGDAVDVALRDVGPALIVTTLTLVCGLSIGLLSQFGPIVVMSGLSAAMIGVALLADLLLLPVLLRGFRQAAATR